MKPIRMIYKQDNESEALAVDVYDINCTHDADGTPTCSFATGWLIKNKNWITAPLWCFEPVKLKTLKEEI